MKAWNSGYWRWLQVQIESRAGLRRHPPRRRTDRFRAIAAQIEALEIRTLLSATTLHSYAGLALGATGAPAPPAPAPAPPATPPPGVSPPSGLVPPGGVAPPGTSGIGSPAQFVSDVRILMGPNGKPFGTSAPTGYTPAQIRHAYAFDKISFGVPADGTGTTIAIVDAFDDPNIVNDLHQFDLAYGLPDPPSFTKLDEFGGTNLPAPDPGWITEIALDVEWSHAVAPGAKIVLVEGNFPSDSDLFTAIDTARNLPGVVAVSMSFGRGEFPGDTTLNSHFLTPNGHQGVTFVASSGDSGAPVSYPSVSPNVLSVGGTNLLLSGVQGNYSSESGWTGSGGGISVFEPQPIYQKGTVTQSPTFRTNPDVSYDSDPSTGFSVYDSYNNGPVQPWIQVGGTSDAAPQWSALIAIADQGRILAGQGSLDGKSQTLPFIYSMPASNFHDITTGFSLGNPVESATPGYDLVTGRGTPIANLVVDGLGGGVQTLPAPQNVQATALSPTTAQVTWDLVTGADLGYEVFMVSGGNILVGTVGAGINTVVATGLTSGVVNTLFVRALSSTVPPGFADSASITLLMPAILTAPQNVSAVVLTPTTARVNWDLVQGADLGYQVFMVSGGNILVGTASAGTNSAVATGLTSGATDTLFVRALSSTLTPGFADSATITITMPPNLSTTILSVTVTSPSTALLNWSAVPGADGYRIYEKIGSRIFLLGYVGPTTTSLNVVGLIHGQTVQFMVEAYSGFIFKDSSWATVTT